jgi:phenylalanyl-tRNA synthetase beta chain
MAYSLVYRAPDRTLTDDEVNAAHQRISDALCERLKAEIRSS